MTPLGHGYYLS